MEGNDKEAINKKINSNYEKIIGEINENSNIQIIAKNKTIINDHEVASISYKNFYKHLEQLKFD